MSVAGTYFTYCTFLNLLKYTLLYKLVKLVIDVGKVAHYCDFVSENTYLCLRIYVAYKFFHSLFLKKEKIHVTKLFMNKYNYVVIRS